MKTYGFNTGTNELPTSESTEGTEINHEDGGAHNPLNYARSIVRDISQSQEFLDTGYSYGYDMTDSGSLDYQFVLADMMVNYTKDNADFFRDNYGEDTLAAITMLGLAPYAVSQQVILSAAEKDKATYVSSEIIGHAKEVVIQFNHAIYGFIDANPKANFDETMAAISKTTADYANYRYAEISVNVKSTLRGIRIEHGFEEVVNELAKKSELGIRHASEEEDRRGIDFVLSDTKNTASVDIKASMKGVDEKAGYKGDGSKNFHKQREGKFVYYPYIDDSVFSRGTFAVKKSALEGLSEPILDDISKMLRAA